MTEILVVIVNYRTPELTVKCLEAVARERAAGARLSAIIVDGCSGDNSPVKLGSFLASSEVGTWAELLPLDFNGGFGWANNQAILHRKDRLPPYIHFLNPDAVVEPGAILALARRLDRDAKIAAVGSQLFEPDGELAASAFNYPTIAHEFVHGAQTSALGRLLGIKPIPVEMPTAGEVDWVTGASVMFRKEALQDVGLFDDGFFLYFEEVELMHRVKRGGWKIWSEPSSRVTHIGGASTGVQESAKPKRKPPYWYNSRLRYFALTHGPFGTIAANLAWITGFAFVRFPRMLFSRKFRLRVASGELKAVLKTGMWARNGRALRSAPDLHGSKAMPAWAGFK